MLHDIEAAIRKLMPFATSVCGWRLTISGRLLLALAVKRFPIDALKIDRSFIRGIPTDKDDMAITEAIWPSARRSCHHRR